MKWKRRLKIALIVAAILQVMAAGLSWKNRIQLEQRLVSLRATGAPISIDSFALSSPVLYNEFARSVHDEDFNYRDGLTEEQIAAAGEASRCEVHQWHYSNGKINAGNTR